MKGLLKQFKNNVRSIKDGGSSSSSSSSTGHSHNSHNSHDHSGGGGGGGGGRTHSSGSGAFNNHSSNLNPSQVNGINHGAAAATNGRPGGNGVAPGVDPSQAVLNANGDARRGGMGIGGGSGGAAGLDRLSGGAAGAGDAMPPPPPKGAAKGGAAAGQLHAGVVAPSSR